MMPVKPIYLASYRHVKNHPWLLILSIVGIALGVAVVVAIDLANTSALRAFEQANQVLTGKTTHRIIGGPTGLPEEYYIDLRLSHGIKQSTPIIEAYGVALDYPGYSFKLIGIDGFSDAPFRSFTTGENPSNDENSDNSFIRLLTEPATALIAKSRADKLSLQLGDQLNILLGEKSQKLTLIAYLPMPHEQSSQALENVLLMDIATAQETLGFHGRLSRIDLILADNAQGQQLLNVIKTTLPAGAQIISTTSSNTALSQMTNAFRTNLTAMSLLALMVGLFIIYNGMSFSVIQRREMFGVLRVLGVTGNELTWIIYAEAVLLGIIGTVLGLLLGIALGYGLLGLVTQTVSNLYIDVDNATLSISFFSLAKGLALGLGATVLAAILPAREARHISPQLSIQKMQLELSLHQLLPRLNLWGVLLLILSIGLLFVFTQSLILSFVSLFLLVIAYSLLVPQIVNWITLRLRVLLGHFFGLKGRMAVHSISRSLSRTAVAMAALTIAVATTLGITIMIESFRESVDDWITQSMRADIYLAIPSIDRHVTLSALSPVLMDNILQLEKVKALSKGRRTTLQSSTGETELLAFELPENNLKSFTFIAGEPVTAWEKFSQQDAVIISEPYAYRNKFSLGDQLQLPTQHGMRPFEIAGIYSDYASERGRVVISLANYRHYWQDQGVSSVGIYLHDDTDEALVLAQLRALLPVDSALSINTKKGIRTATLVVFDRTFAITEVLRLLTIGVAFVGIFSALMALQLERARELAMLRAMGLTPRELGQLVIAETGLIGLIVGVISLPLGILLSIILVHVINQRSFGWSMTMTLDLSQIMSALLLALIAAILAGLYPAYRMANTSPALALRNE